MIYSRVCVFSFAVINDGEWRWGVEICCLTLLELIFGINVLIIRGGSMKAAEVEVGKRSFGAGLDDLGGHVTKAILTVCVK